MVHVIATVELAPGTREKFLSEFRKIIPEVRAEAGCIEYGPAVDAKTDIPIQFRLGADKVVVIEKWESEDALKAHAAAPHMKAYGEKNKDLIAGRVLHVVKPVSRAGSRAAPALVPRFRSSRYIAATSDTNFGSKGALATI